MKETKLTKRILAGFVAFIVILLISCGDLQVFASSASVTLSISVSNPTYISYVYGYVDSEGNLIPLVSDTGLIPSSISLDLNNPDAVCFYIYQRIYRYSSNTGWTYYSISFRYNGSNLAVDKNNPKYIDSLTPTFTGNYITNDNTYFYFYFDVPATPTPEPTPTPVPTPTPEPTFNPDQPTYTTFFNHLLNDGNNALNALYLSWTQANNKFYTGIFFIGLPIMIGIFGIVASIFFGGDD